MASDSVATVENVSKIYRLYNAQRDRLKQFFLPPARRLLGMKPKLYFKEFQALQNVSFDVRRGETVGVVGRNGSGKSTLLQIVCGTLNPSAGHVSTRGRIGALLELGSGFNPQFTGRENVYVNGAVHGLRHREIKKRIDKIAEFADIGEFFDQPVRTYSSGMYVRLAFSVITHTDADILIIDEALAVGDALFTQKCMRFLHEFRKNNAVLFVSHDLQAVTGLCDKAIYLDKGTVAAAGDANDVVDCYLSSLHVEGQTAARKKPSQSELPRVPVDGRDMRADFLNASPYRNDIEIFVCPESPENPGNPDAEVTAVRMTDEDGAACAWIVGGENVRLEIFFQVHVDICRPIIGFSFKNRLGQILFADDSSGIDSSPAPFEAGENGVARFSFRLPFLQAGEYSIDVVIGEILPDRHICRLWEHDALLLTAHAGPVHRGLLKIPMQNIVFEKG